MLSFCSQEVPKHFLHIQLLIIHFTDLPPLPLQRLQSAQRFKEFLYFPRTSAFNLVIIFWQYLIKLGSSLELSTHFQDKRREGFNWWIFLNELQFQLNYIRMNQESHKNLHQRAWINFANNPKAILLLNFSHVSVPSILFASKRMHWLSTRSWKLVHLAHYLFIVLIH